MQFVWSIGGGSRCRVIRACVCYLVQTFCTEQRFQTFRAQLGGECRELTTDMKSSFLPLLVFSLSHSVMSDSLQPHGLYSPWNYLGQNTGVGGLSLLQGIFPTQGLNPGLLHCRQILYHLSHQGSPLTLTSLDKCLFSECIKSLLCMRVCQVTSVVSDSLWHHGL